MAEGAIANSMAVDLAIGRSSVRQRILALLMTDTGGRLHLREIQRRVETSPGTASRELAKLVGAGLVEREAEGHQVYFRASISPFATMLRSVILAMPAPPRPSLQRRLPHTDPGAASRAASEGGGPAGLATVDAPGSDAADDLGRKRGETAASPAKACVKVAAESGFLSDHAPSDSTVSPETIFAPPRIFGPAPPRSAIRSDRVGVRVAGRLADSFRQIYGASLRGMYLHGARVAGPASVDAEVETIIVLDRVNHYGAELERTSQVCAVLSREMNVIVSRIFVSEAEWEAAFDGAASPGLVGAVAI